MHAIRAAAWQYQPTRGQPGRNLAALERVLNDPACRDIDLLVAPELFLTGGGDDARIAFSLDDAFLKVIGRLCQEHGIWFAASVLLRRAGRLHNTFVLWSPEGKVVGEQDKIHLWDHEKDHVTPGDKPHPIQTAIGAVGGMVCYDVEFPEVARALAVGGAELFLVPSAFYAPSSWEIMTRARALENGCFLVAANQVGGDAANLHNGQSRIVDPFGTTIAEVHEPRNGLAVADLDPGLIGKARIWAPLLRDRRLGFPAPSLPPTSRHA